MDKGIGHMVRIWFRLKKSWRLFRRRHLNIRFCRKRDISWFSVRLLVLWQELCCIGVSEDNHPVIWFMHCAILCSRCLDATQTSGDRWLCHRLSSVKNSCFIGFDGSFMTHYTTRTSMLASDITQFRPKDRMRVQVCYMTYDLETSVL